jgi:hypothetical protein
MLLGMAVQVQQIQAVVALVVMAEAKAAVMVVAAP